jgi:hypothetical protein
MIYVEVEGLKLGSVLTKQDRRRFVMMLLFVRAALVRLF